MRAAPRYDAAAAAAAYTDPFAGLSQTAHKSSKTPAAKQQRTSKSSRLRRRPSTRSTRRRCVAPPFPPFPTHCHQADSCSLRYAHPQHESEQSTASSAVEKETEAELKRIDESYKKNRDDVVQKLLDRVVKVKTEMHRNAVKVE